MSLEDALEIAEKELSDHPNEDVVFDIFGGEPFLAFDLIPRFCETLWERHPDRNLHFSCITNGTLIDDTIAGWLQRNSNRFFSHISLDGTPQMHYANRGEKMPVETAKLFAKIWPNRATAKMTVSKETLGSLFEGVLYLNELGLRVAPSLARGLEWDDSDLDIYRRELRHLVDYYSKNPDKEPIEMFQLYLRPVLLEEMREGYCGAGYSTCAYSPEGKKYPCHMFAPISMDKALWDSVKYTDLRADKQFYSDKDCIKCCVRNLCKKCPGKNLIERGAIGNRDKNLCKFIMAEFSAVARYKLNTLLQKPLETLSKLDYYELKAAKQLAEMIDI